MKRPIFALALFTAVTLGCDDPMRDRLLDALPDEAPGFEPSAFHRPGQPCLACHSEYGAADPEFSIGGTVFAVPKDATEAPFMLTSYTVRLIDAEGETRTLRANRCGNFFSTKQDWDPAFPLRAELYRESDPKDPSVLVQDSIMASRIGRDGSCASCHIHPKSPFSPGVVEAVKVASDVAPPSDCPPPWLGPDPRLPEITAQ
ncbi:MAG: hypothetical protein EXR75_08495 [Myxococcales bacterium]|nr:hypothetical protein [Myxococcales bacterium]